MKSMVAIGIIGALFATSTGVAVVSGAIDPMALLGQGNASAQYSEQVDHIEKYQGPSNASLPSQGSSSDWKEKRDERAGTGIDEAQAAELTDEDKDLAGVTDSEEAASTETIPANTGTETVSDAVTDNAEATAKTGISKKEKKQARGTIKIFGEEIPYICSYSVASAPDKGAGVWKGSERTDDNNFCYFIGHNPGDFYNVMKLDVGDVVSVMDTNGHKHNYTVRDTFVRPQRTSYDQIQDRVEGHGESIILQTCCGDNVNIRIVVAY